MRRPRGWFPAHSLFLVVLAVSSVWHRPALAHHSWARYDSGEVVTIVGEVTKVEWASPHVFMYFTATHADGTVTDWTMEMDPPTLLDRYGLRHDTIRSGMTIKVTGVQARSGAPVMRAVMIELEDGTVHRVSSRV